jgi:hypothetical protein
MNADELVLSRQRLERLGVDTSAMSDEDIQALAAERARKFLEEAPTTAAQAAKIILDGVKAERWRILVGDDAQLLDKHVRQDPEHAYDTTFFESFAKEVGWRVS